MSGRFRRLFGRYSAYHLSLSRAGAAVQNATRSPLGYVDQIALRHDRLVVSGRVTETVQHVSLTHGGRSSSTVPELRQSGPDFSLDLPFCRDTAKLTLETGTDSVHVTLPQLARWQLAMGTAQLVPGFLWRSVQALPAVVRWFRHKDPSARDDVRRCFGLGLVKTAHPLDPALFSPPTRPVNPPGAARITIILPVYGAFDLLQECLTRLVQHTDLPWHLIVIDDASPDQAIRPWLRDWAAGQPEGQVTLLENAQNLGFIGTVNRGFAEAQARGAGDAVVLLNSDALAPAAWASRLVAPMLADPARVASVTPMSNDAELACVPVICARHDLATGEAEAIDRAAAALPAGAGLVAGVTGVGFCMALNPVFLAHVPQFDTAFGRGYGEEVDWCQKTAAWGGQHLYQPRLFVEHRGGHSFGSDEKRKLLAQNGAIISARYPHFDAEVQVFLAEDPLLSARLALGLALAAHRAQARGQDAGRLCVYLAHAIGGGAEDWLRSRIAQDIAARSAAIVLRVGGDQRWRIELHTVQGMSWGETGDTQLMQRVLEKLPARRVVYSCGVGDRSPQDLPRVLAALSEGPEHALEVLFHDFFPISPSYTLLDGTGHWRGLPAPDTRDKAHLWRRPDGQRIGLDEWQAGWGALLAKAERVVTFSQNSRALVSAVWPGIADKVVVTPHQLPQPPTRLPAPPADAPPVIGVLGNIGAHKGAGVLAALSRQLRKHSTGLVVLGKVDPAFRLVRPARIHGGYDLAELPQLVRRYGITCWLIPSVWPETFSFTTHEALATGLPVWCFDLGAQGEAVAKAVAEGAPGGVLPLPEGRADPDRILRQIFSAQKLKSAECH